MRDSNELAHGSESYQEIATFTSDGQPRAVYEDPNASGNFGIECDDSTELMR